MGVDLSRSEALIGSDALARLKRARVLVVGVGGVGSWCAEALVRTGVGAVTLVDDDLVQPSNVNRQCPATQRTVGRRKVEAMRERLLEIAPACEVVALPARYDADFARRAGVSLKDFSLVIDAIDSVREKAALISETLESGVPLLSSMGAARRRDPTLVTIERFDRVAGDGLARALRVRFKAMGLPPRPKFWCAVSREVPAMTGRADVKGSIMPVTCAFGMALAARAISDLTREAQKGQSGSRG